MYKIKKPIPGFETLNEAIFKQIDENFALLQIGDFTFTLINPFALIKDYSFEVPADVKVLLNINEENLPLVYCNLIKKEPFTESIVNFKAPILLNPRNNTLAQVVLDEYSYAPLKEFIKE
ncbi:flagellar assembly protein FliW [Caminibacter profundus]